MIMEAVADPQQDGPVADLLSEGQAIPNESSSSGSSLTQVSIGGGGGAGAASAVTLVQLPGGQTLQVQGVIQAPQTSVIQSPHIQSMQVGAVAETEDGELAETVTDTHKRREILARRPSYRKILNELSLDTAAIPKIEEEKLEEEGLPPSAAQLPTPASIYQTSSGQYIAIAPGGAIQITGPGSDGLQGLSLPGSAGIQSGATIVQYATQPGDATQQLFVPSGQVVVQAATGEVPAYQIRTPVSGLAQNVVMATSPSGLHSPQQQHAEETTRKREVRLMKNREAARECRRKKKEYVKCLENRVAVLENQNKTLIEELKALKDIYCHKTE